jgi:predicted GIY-YIG superfamily endonuclease
MYIVYVLISPRANKTYVGYTADLARRMVEHNQIGKGVIKAQELVKEIFKSNQYV